MLKVLVLNYEVSSKVTCKRSCLHAHLNHPVNMAAPAVEDFLDNVDECYVDDVVDNKSSNSSKLRSTKGFTEIFIIMMALALNEMTTKNDSMFFNAVFSFLFFPFLFFSFLFLLREFSVILLSVYENRKQKF
jgi:hypothetical protein